MRVRRDLLVGGHGPRQEAECGEQLRHGVRAQELLDPAAASASGGPGAVGPTHLRSKPLGIIRSIPSCIASQAARVGWRL